MTYRPPARSARARATILWDVGDVRGDAELATELGVTARTLRAYHQKWRRENGIGGHGGRTLPNAVVVAVIEMRNNAGMTFPAIAEVVGEDYGHNVSAEHVRLCYHRGVAMGAGRVADVLEEDLPLATFAGVVRTVPEVMRGPCGKCRHRDGCPSANTESMLPCERPLDWEVMGRKLVGMERIPV